MSRALNAPRMVLLASAANNTEEIHETNPADAHAETDPDTQEETSVPANLPEAPEFKKYVKDVDPDTGNDWQTTIVLNKGNTPAAWKDTLKDLEACDADGNPYYYYVAAVDETGLEKVTTVSFGNNGDELLLIGQDNLDGNTLNVTNTVKRLGALALTKTVTLNGVDNTTDMTDGDYSFTIQGVAGTATEGISHNVTIRFANGRATRYIVDGTATECKGLDNSWTVVLQELTAGDYVITESPMTNEKMVLKSVTGGKDDGDVETRKVTVTVHPGDEEPVNDDAKATFTNDRTEKVTVTVRKLWDPEPLASENPSITLQLHRYAKKTKGTINITLKDTMEDDPTHVSAPIEGARFTLYEADTPEGTWTATSTMVTTDVNGNASVSGLAPGKSYKLVQTFTPPRYKYDTNNPPASGVLTVQDNSLATQEVSTNLTNEAKITSATVTLTLTESSEGSGNTNNKIDGATFDLYKDGALYNQGYETMDGGKIVVSGLKPGDYYFVQTATTADYRMPADPKTVGFTVADDPTIDQTGITQSMTNDLKGKGTITVQLHKDTASGDPIEGAEFQLKQGDRLIGSDTTSSDGTVTFMDVYEGTYTVVQIDAGSAESDGYEPETNPQTVTIDANSITNQTPDPVVFVNESTRGNVTIHLWVNQGKSEYNWAKISDVVDGATFEYPYLKAGETYSFTATFDSGMYSQNIWTYWDIGDMSSFTYEGYSEGEHVNKYRHTLVTDNIAFLNGNNYNGGTYSFTFPIPDDAPDGTIYNLAMVSGWGFNNITSFSMSQPKTFAASAAAPMSKTVSFAGKKTVSRLSAGKAHIPLKNPPATTEAQPHKPSAADYFEDTVNFTPIEHTITKSPWTYTFPAQDKYDPNGEPYYYYVEETASTPDEYVIASYEGDPVHGVDAGEVRITNTREKYGSLKLTKAVTVNRHEPANAREWAMVEGNYTFTVKQGGTAVKTITLCVNNTGVSLVSPTADADVTLADGVVTIAKLPMGNYTVEETTPTNGTTLTDVTVSTSGSAANQVATVTVNDKNQQVKNGIPLVTFTNNINTGDLRLTKNVTGEDADEDKAFVFTVELTAPSGQTLADSYTFKKNNEAASGITYAKDPTDPTKATITDIALKHGDTFTIEGLPEDTTYKITEDDYSSEGYSSDLPAGGKEGTIAAGSSDANAVTVNNEFSAGSLTVEKAIGGNAKDPNKDFSFKVTFEKDGLTGVKGSYKKGTEETIETAEGIPITFSSEGRAEVTFALKGGEKAVFTNLPIDTTFTVEEVSKDDEGYETTVSSTGGTANADKTVTGSISATTAVTASYLNKKETTTAQAAKVWKQGETTIAWPEDVASVDFTLYKTVGSTETMVEKTDLTDFWTAEALVGFTNPAKVTSEALTASWENLPSKYLVNGEWVEATYTIKETKVTYTDDTYVEGEALTTAFNPQNGENNTIVNELPTVDIHATKDWLTKDEEHTPPEDAEVTFTLLADGGETEHTVVLNGVDETADDAGTDYEGADWTAYFTQLPKYNADGTVIQYTVKETGTWTNYEVEGEDTVENGGTITNKEQTGELQVTKEIHKNGALDADATGSFRVGIFKLTQSGETWTEAEKAETIKPIEVTVNGAATVKFDNLRIGDRYAVYEVDDEGHKLESDAHTGPYTVRYKDNTGLTIAPGTTPTAKVVNDLELADIEVSKKWLQSDGTTDITGQIQNASVTLELQKRTGEGKWTKVEPTKEENPQTVEATGDWKASWTDLPKYEDGALIQYKVVETAATVNDESVLPDTAPEVELVMGAADDTAADEDDETAAAEGNEKATGEIDNTLPTVPVTVNKAWGGNGAWPEDIAVQMTLTATVDDQEIAPTLPDIVTHNDETDEDEAETQTAVVLLDAENPSHTWQNLPKYTDAGVEIVYTVNETGMFYKPADGEMIAIADWAEAFDSETTTGEDGITITNTPKETEFEVTKEWTLNGTALTNKEKIKFEVYQKLDKAAGTRLENVYVSVGEADPELNNSPTVTVAYAEGTWQVVKVSKLPKYVLVPEEDSAAYVEATYYVVETDGPGEDTHVTYLAAETAEQTQAEPVDPQEESGNANAEKADPTKASITGGSITIINRDYSVDIRVEKIDETTRDDANPTKLNGAKFKLYKYMALEEGGSKNYLPYPNEESYEYETEDEGALTISNLPDGEYKIEESRTPDGYIKTVTNDIYFELENGVTTRYTASVEDNAREVINENEDAGNLMVTYRKATEEAGSQPATFTVGNTPGAKLPSTGGVGTNVIYAAGVGLLILAAIWFVWDQKKKYYRNDI